MAQSTRPKQLRNREVSWEGSHRSKLMSRRTERPYKVDGTGKLAQHSEAQCSVPEINGPVAQQEFTSLLRETCNPGLSATTGLAASNGAQAGAGVSRGHSTGSNEPDNNTGRTHNPGRAELGRQTRPSVVLPGAMRPNRLSYGQRSSWQRKSAASFRKDCQEPPYADPHVRWCGRREGKLSRRPDWSIFESQATPRSSIPSVFIV